MRYMNDFDLQYTDVPSSADMYPALNECDIQDAVYRRCVDTDPDICAMPAPLAGRELVRKNTMPYPGYSPAAVKEMSCADRIACLRSAKDLVTIYLPCHAELEKMIYGALISAYRHRRYGLMEQDGGGRKVLSVSSPIDSSVQDISVIGVAGTGKSRGVKLTLDRIPRAVRHNINGIRYLQIPYLLTAASRGSDIKSLFIGFAQQIDRISGMGYHEEKMISARTVARMESYLRVLIQQYHVGLIVIDEIQLAIVKKNRKETAADTNPMFDHLLTVTAMCGVSVCIIGTEDAVAGLNKNVWFVRRFSQLGRISTVLGKADRAELEIIAKQLLYFQWTRQRYPVTQDIIDALIEESGGSIDFMSTIVITAQLLSIESEKTGDPMPLDADAVRKAADQYPMAKSYIRAGADTIEEYLSEKERALAAIGARADAAREKEKMMEDSKKYFSESVEVIADITDRINLIDDVDHATVERIYKKLTASQDMASMPAKQRAKLVHAAVLEDREKKKKKEASGKKVPSRPAGKAKKDGKDTEPLLEGLKKSTGSLDAALSAVTA